ncbi:hypothetical protein VI817_008519 [Penicillium citrinum]|nr:hypothetical protein VI817_008519 [Penicillium citrinum]
MPLFESVSKIFAQLSPRRQRHHQPDDRQQTLRQSSSQDDRSLAHSRETSPCPSQRERTARPSGNQFSLPSEYQTQAQNGISVERLFYPPRNTAALSQVC